MAAIQQISDAIIQKSISEAVRNVSQTMLRRDVTLVSQGHDPDPNTTYEIIDTVGFAGEINGSVYLCMSEQFAYHAIGLMLGMTKHEIDLGGPDVVKDAIGEVTNMTVGGFKNHLCDIGFPCMLTLPTIMRGSKLAIANTKSTICHVFEFKCDGHALIADIRIKTD
jgi:chemotaxis protein CheX